MFSRVKCFNHKNCGRKNKTFLRNIPIRFFEWQTTSCSVLRYLYSFWSFNFKYLWQTVTVLCTNKIFKCKSNYLTELMFATILYNYLKNLDDYCRINEIYVSYFLFSLRITLKIFGNCLRKTK